MRWTMMDLLFAGVGWTDIAITLNRIAVGAFFMLSGYHKLFNAERHRTIVDELKALGVPAVGFNQWWVPLVEFAAGGAVLVGLLAPLAALGLRSSSASSPAHRPGGSESNSTSRPMKRISIRRLALFTGNALCLHVDHGRLGRRRAVQPRCPDPGSDE